MNKHKILSAGLLAMTLVSSCDLLSPDEVKNPNVEEGDFVNTPNAMRTWVNGCNARFAAGLSKITENLEILSDNVLNNSSRSNKTWDRLEVYYTDGAISLLSTHIGEMIEMANFGLNTIATKDVDTTPADCFNLCYIKACAYLMASENFIALPKSANGKVLESKKLAEAAIETIDESEIYTSGKSEKALMLLLKARAYRIIGKHKEAADAAKQSLSLSGDLLYQAKFDDLNGVGNSFQSFVAQELFTINPALYAQKAKCPQADLYNQPIAFAKSEEAWLICAEYAIRSNRPDEARSDLSALLSLIGQREPSATIATATEEDIEAATSNEELMTLICRLRQEVFFGEGRRASDLGFRLPISEVEYYQQKNLPEQYTKVSIPAYITSLSKTLDETKNLNELLSNEWIKNRQ